MTELLSNLGHALAAIWDNARTHIYAGISGAGAAASILISNVMPFLQFVAVVISIGAGIASWRASRRK